MIKNLAGLFVLTTLILMSGASVYAQEEVIAIEGEVDVEITDDGSATTTEEVVEEELIVEDELTEEEIQNILDEEEVLTEEDIVSLEDLEGEIIAVTDEVVIIEQPSGDIIVVDTATYEKVASSGGGGGKAVKGQKVETGTMSNGNVTTKSGTYSIPSNATVTKNGQSVSASDLKDGDKITAIFDSNGNLIALELASQMEKATTTVVVGTIIAIAAILALYSLSKRKGAKTEQV
ncbi:hypothetical protein KKH05_01175 [Patescibacteria group bacterium]|nr:hypothetical protein [Patescibacteria group bacterium]